LFLVCAVFIGAYLSLTGFDYSLQDCNSGSFSPSTYNCFKNNGFGFTVIQAVQGGNGQTQNIVNCLANAANAGFYVSLYGWFCPQCSGQSNAYNTAYNVIMSLKKKGIIPGQNYTYFYVDVEDCDPNDDCWGTHAVNRQYVIDLVRGIRAAGASPAIYASPYEWNLLMGDPNWSNPSLSSLPLWYPNWNGNDDMSGFSSFGGWTSPHMHQWADSCSVCYNVDQNFIYGK